MTSELQQIELIEPDYMTLMAFERNFDPFYWRTYMRHTWSISVYLAALYLVLVFGGQFLMRNRKPFKLNGWLTVWNILLGIMSICAFVRSTPEFIDHMSSGNGLYHTICEWRNHNRASAFWALVVIFSKIVEFGDTAFIVLRKGDLKFIHYFHHVVTAISWWYMYPFYEPVCMWFGIMNLGIHSVMYPYYALRAMKVSVPRTIAMAITSCQILQMFVGLFINLYSAWVMYIVGTPADCPHRTTMGVSLGLTLYLSFAIIFFRFFITNYITGTAKIKSKKM